MKPTIVAGIDVHKSVLMVVVGEFGGPEDGHHRRRFGAVRSELRALAAWLKEEKVEAVVMESTAQYWWPLWLELEGQWQLHLAQAHSNRGPHQRKTDFGDAARLVRRFLSSDLRFSFVPGTEQRTWRRLTRTRTSLTAQIVEIRGEIEALLEEG